MKIGVLTGGGDCAGLNAVIRAVVKRAEDYGFQVIGIRYGWAGLINEDAMPLSYNDVREILDVGGTILKTSRTNPLKNPADAEKVLANVKNLGIDALVAIGGEDTLGAAHKLAAKGLRVVGVPKTIDNDLSSTDVTFGFDSAVNAAMEMIDRIRTTAASHDRVIVVEVMGRHTGWIAIEAGLAAGADLILIPEHPFDLDKICQQVKTRVAAKGSAVVVVAEGATLKTSPGAVSKESKVDEFGHVRLGGVGDFLADEIEKRTGLETRSVTLGHVVRGGSPSAFDRVLATRFGVAAVDLVKEGKFDMMVSLQGTQILPVKLEEAVAKLKTVDGALFNAVRTFFE